MELQDIKDKIIKVISMQTEDRGDKTLFDLIVSIEREDFTIVVVGDYSIDEQDKLYWTNISEFFLQFPDFKIETEESFKTQIEQLLNKSQITY